MHKFAIASDHAGYELKDNLINYLKDEGIDAEDYGPYSCDPVDYPDYGKKLAQSIVRKKNDRGIIICGTGIGMSIVVNRFPGIRGTLCGDIYTAKLSRQHNNSNILILGGRLIASTLAVEIVNTWINTPFEGGRHLKRLNKIEEIDLMFQKGDI